MEWERSRQILLDNGVDGCRGSEHNAKDNSGVIFRGSDCVYFARNIECTSSYALKQTDSQRLEAPQCHANNRW